MAWAAEFLRLATASGVPLKGSLVLMAFALGVALAFAPGCRLLSRYSDTLFHELGHATAAALTGSGRIRFSIHWDTSGLTTSYGRQDGLALLSTWVGYASPGLVGSALVWAAGSARQAQVLGLLTLLLALSLLIARSLIALAVTFSHAALFAIMLWRPQETWQAIGVGAIGAMLYTRGLVTAIGLLRMGAAGPASDPAKLYVQTGLPRWIWRLSYPVV